MKLNVVLRFEKEQMVVTSITLKCKLKSCSVSSISSLFGLHYLNMFVQWLSITEVIILIIIHYKKENSQKTPLRVSGKFLDVGRVFWQVGDGGCTSREGVVKEVFFLQMTLQKPFAIYDVTKGRRTFSILKTTLLAGRVPRHSSTKENEVKEHKE